MATQDTKNPILANSIISPGFKSAAAMAGWDEEALLASLVVEDTPIRESRHKKRPKTKSSSNSKRKRRLRRQSIDPIPAVVLCLDDEEDDDAKKDNIPENKEKKDVVADEEDEDQKKNKKVNSNGKDSSNKGIACMDKLREELSCAICLEICFEPSTTQCGHSFCMKCLKNAASKCGKKCPKCRQMISNARSCTINTVLWNTIQLLFPDDIEARKNAVPTKADSPEPANHRTQTSRNTRIMPRTTNIVTAAEPANHRTQTSRNTRIIPRSNNFITAAQVVSAIERDVESSITRRRRALLTQNQDAALALRLQREEFMEADNNDNEQSNWRSIDSARANLRAMASSRYHIRTRGRY